MTNLEPMPDTGKPATRSVTIWSTLTALLGVLVPPILAHFHVGSADAQEATGDLGNIIAAVGSLAAIYGRWTATKPITSITSQKES